MSKKSVAILYILYFFLGASWGAFFFFLLICTFILNITFFWTILFLFPFIALIIIFYLAIENFNLKHKNL